MLNYLFTSEGFDLVLIIVDKSSKYENFIPCKGNCTAPDLDRIFYNHIVCKFGMPKKIVGNRYRRFFVRPGGPSCASYCILWQC